MNIVDIVLVEDARLGTKVGSQEAVPYRCLSLLDRRGGPLWMLAPTSVKLMVGNVYLILGRVSTYYGNDGKLNTVFRVDEARPLRIAWALRRLVELGDPLGLLPTSERQPDPSAGEVEEEPNDTDVPF